MSWNLRYAAHLGFRSLETPLFPASAGSADPLAQIDFAASIGFAGIQDPWFATRPRATQDDIVARVAVLGLAAGCVVCGTPASIRTPLWNAPGDAARSRLESELRSAFDAARRLGARQIAVLTGLDPDQPRERQIETMIDRLAWAAALAESEGVCLCLEPTNARTLTGMLLSHFDEGCTVARAAGHPAVRMIFDTAHVQSMDGDLVGRLERAWDLVEIVQIANHPSRTEPEVGEIQMATILRKVHAMGYRGLVELEHLWAQPGVAAERRGLDWLRRADTEFTSTEKGAQP
jgi:hydroxypyruvate isomerase